MNTRLIIACAYGVICVLAGPASAAGPVLTPGKWEFKTTSVMPMSGEPTTRTEIKCITSKEAKADPLAAIVEEDRCKVLNQTRTDDSITFEIECDGDQKMKMRGKGIFTASGGSASGKMDMSMNMPAMPNMPPQMAGKMTMTQTWSGKRLGECD